MSGRTVGLPCLKCKGDFYVKPSDKERKCKCGANYKVEDFVKCDECDQPFWSNEHISYHKAIDHSYFATSNCNETAYMMYGDYRQSSPILKRKLPTPTSLLSAPGSDKII
jgi:hypothetical protein